MRNILSIIKPNYLNVIFLLPIIAYIVFEFLMKRIENPYHLSVLLTPLFFYYILSYLFTYMYKGTFNISHTYLLVSAFVVIDQIIKLVVYKTLINSKIALISGYIYIKPSKNYHNSAALNYFNVEFVPLTLVVIFKIILLFAIVTLYYSLCKSSEYNNFWLTFSYIFFMCGTICSTLDSLVWGYSLDYIYISLFGTIDLKDIFIDIGISCFIISNLVPSLKSMK